mmetsp:Transcript_2168/g.2486  ORF Transcript_2168/g.2486 Transcript_2168/m.2486 type:complete len:183 (+) Transcript_2168:1-549(+)|eukprot:CAMPEP_0205825176 /NCGR_PEP_ID=MMETSP0206-20130828/24221_1 /ASSEMBLY_ACC=CAM_ASM_000279 /TAXON_ID=36767 /ORGANISM="Euplotes focardii, Strain TN1" /LENGTH=182 /DNA_ID=CAMNT_0053123999 /DNA_START=1 /DNA_END=549 /DNA_ORIENTATION=+
MESKAFTEKPTEEVKQLTKADNIDIIIAKPDHSDILAEFNYKMAYETEDIKIDAALVSKAIHRLVSDSSDEEGHKPYGFYLVAINAELAPIGCMLVTNEINPTLGGLNYMIQSVFVEKEYRKCGVFRKLFNKTKEIAENDKDCKCLRLYVETENTVAQAVYKKMGMDHVDFSFMEKDFIFNH